MIHFFVSLLQRCRLNTLLNCKPGYRQEIEIHRCVGMSDSPSNAQPEKTQELEGEVATVVRPAFWLSSDFFWDLMH